MREYVLESEGREAPSSLDGIKHNRNSFCGCWTLKGKPKEGGQRTHYARLGCKRWSCSRCGPKKARRLRRAIIDRATEKGLCRMLTLTLDPSRCAPEDSVAYIRQCWNKLRTYLKRRFKSSVSFIAVVEFQKSGHAHLHILVDRFIPQDWIREAWQVVGGGRIVDIRLVDIHRVGPYISKYLTKDLFLTPAPRRFRRCTTSRDIVLFVRTPGGTWELIKKPLEWLYSQRPWAVMEEKRDENNQLEWFRASPSPTAGTVGSVAGVGHVGCVAPCPFVSVPGNMS